MLIRRGCFRHARPMICANASLEAATTLSITTLPLVGPLLPTVPIPRGGSRSIYPNQLYPSLKCPSARPPLFSWAKDGVAGSTICLIRRANCTALCRRCVRFDLWLPPLLAVMVPLSRKRPQRSCRPGSTLPISSNSARDTPEAWFEARNAEVPISQARL